MLGLPYSPQSCSSDQLSALHRPWMRPCGCREKSHKTQEKNGDSDLPSKTIRSLQKIKKGKEAWDQRKLQAH